MLLTEALPLPPIVAQVIADEHLHLVASEPPRSNGSFSVYFTNSERTLHVSFRSFCFVRASWIEHSVPDLSAIAFSFLLRAGISPALARLKAAEQLTRAGLTFLFAIRK